MKNLSVLILALLCIQHSKAQQLIIKSDQQLLKGDMADTLVVKEATSDISIRIILTISEATVDTYVTADNLDMGSAGLPADYDYNVALPNVYHFNHSNNFTNIITVNIKTDTEKEKDEYAELDFKWPSLLIKNKELHKILYIKIIDKESKAETDTKGTVVNAESAIIHPDASNTNKYELIQFTDFIGFDNDKPNGRLQQEFRFKWGIAKNWRGDKNKWQWQFLRSVIFPDILLNRIDKSQKEETYNYPAYIKNSPNPDSSAPKFTTMDIWKYSNLRIGFRAILLALQKENFRFHIQGGIQLIRNRPFVDTSSAQNGQTDSSIFRPTFSVAYSAEIYGKTLLSQKESLNMDFTAGVMFLYLHDSYYKQYDAAMVDQYDRAGTLLAVDYPRKKVKPIYNFSCRLMKNIGKEKDDYIYFRANYMFQTGTYNPVIRRITNTGNIIYGMSETRRFYNHFLQMQLGISLDLKKLFQNTPDDKKDEKGKSGAISDSNQ